MYRQHAGDVYRFCLFQLRDAAVAEDVAADVFVSALGAYERARPPEDEVRIWLIHIARNAVIDHHRRERRWRLLMSRVSADDGGKNADVEAIAGMNAEMRQLLETLASLRPRDRLLISLRHGAGLSFDEIAEITGMPANSASVATRRAIESLRSRAGGLFDG